MTDDHDPDHAQKTQKKTTNHLLENIVESLT